MKKNFPIYIYILAVFTLLVVENQYPSPETPFDSPFFILIVYMKEKKVFSCTKSITVLRRFQIIIMLWPNRAPPSPFSLIDKDHEPSSTWPQRAIKRDGLTRSGTCTSTLLIAAAVPFNFFQCETIST